MPRNDDHILFTKVRARFCFISTFPSDTKKIIKFITICVCFSFGLSAIDFFTKDSLLLPPPRISDGNLAYYCSRIGLLIGVSRLFTGHAQDKRTIITVLDFGEESVICRYVVKYTSNLIT